MRARPPASPPGAILMVAILALAVVLTFAVAVVALGQGGDEDAGRVVRVRQAQETAGAGAKAAVRWIEARDVTSTPLATQLSAVTETSPQTGSLDGSCYRFWFDNVDSTQATVDVFVQAYAPGSGAGCEGTSSGGGSYRLVQRLTLSSALLGYAIAGDGITMGGGG